MILAPLRLSSVAVSSPRPEVPPVMMTVLPTRLVNNIMMMIILLWFLELAMCKVQVYLPWLAVAQRAFHKMFQCKVHESSNHTKYYRQTNNPDPNSWNVDPLECFDISISLLLPGIILSMISSLAILDILFTTWNFKTWNWSLCLTLSDILVKNYHIIWATFLSYSTLWKDKTEEDELIS